MLTLDLAAAAPPRDPTNLAFPLPGGRAQLEAIFGAFTWHDLSGGNVEVDSAWEMDSIVRVRNVGGTGLSIRLHHKLAEHFDLALRAALAEAPEYKVRMVGGYCPRHELHNPALPLSVHSWGAAVDFNWDACGIGAASSCDMPPEFVLALEDWGFYWGGRFRNRDSMHFQYAHGV